MSTILKYNANVYAYITDKDKFDDIALAWYKTSGKFDRNSYGRWIDDKFKTQLVRASIDNSIVFLPSNLPHDSIREDMLNNIMLIGFNNAGVRIAAIGIVVGYSSCPTEMFEYSHMILVHVLSTSLAASITLEQMSGIDNLCLDQKEYLPLNVFKLADDVVDKIDIGLENLTYTQEYEKHIIFAHAYGKYLDAVLDVCTPVKVLEDERKKRILALKYQIEQKREMRFPSARQKFSIENIIKLYKRFTS